MMFRSAKPSSSALLLLMQGDAYRDATVAVEYREAGAQALRRV